MLRGYPAGARRRTRKIFLTSRAGAAARKGRPVSGPLTGESAMAFGRDGSELELTIFDLQNKKMREALRKIINKSRDAAIVKIARNAIDEADEIGMRLGG